MMLALWPGFKASVMLASWPGFEASMMCITITDAFFMQNFWANLY